MYDGNKELGMYDNKSSLRANKCSSSSKVKVK